MAKSKHAAGNPVLPLKGQAQFTQLLRTRPLAHWENVRVYAANRQPVNQPTNVNTAATTFFLGQIVPKKQLPLAVDRNRVRRIARAHLRTLQQASGLVSVDVLLKINIEKRSKTKAAPSVERNPHTRAFSRGLHNALRQAVARLEAQPQANQQ